MPTAFGYHITYCLAILTRFAIMAYCHQSYDDFFIEPYDIHGKPYHDNTRVAEQHKKRDIQLAIAEELSQLASEEYRDDILNHMEQMEVSWYRSPLNQFELTG